MPLILNIDTATEKASICLSKGDEIIHTLYNEEQKDHAGWIQPAIQQLMKEASYTLKDVKAVAVTEGPGSYTGLRIGLSTAKGLCFALQVPLITENTLRVMAMAAKEKWLLGSDESILLCPMIDARRMEVFTAVYDKQLKEIRTPNSLIIDDFSFKKELNKNFILFFGGGSCKWKPLCSSPNALFRDDVIYLAPFLSKLAAARFLQHQYTDLAYSEPAYLKEFYSYIKK